MNTLTVTPEPTVRPSRHRTVLVSSLLGTTIEWYDFFLYSTAAGLVFNTLFFQADSALIATMLSFGTFFVGFLARPLGAVLFGHIGDRLGRKSTLVTTMLLMGVGTALIGLVPTYEQIGYLAPLLLVALRIVQGLAVGGEWAGAMLMAVEHASGHRRGWYGSWPQVGLALGLALGTGLFALLGHVLDKTAFLTYGWRIAFLLSLGLVVIGLMVRLRVEETPAFQALRHDRRHTRVPLFELFRERINRRHLLLGMLARWADGAAFNTWAVFALSYTTLTLGLARSWVLGAVTVAAIVMALLIPLIGRAVDRWSSRRVYLTGTILFGLSVYPAFLGFQTRNALLIAGILVATLGAAYAVSYAAQGTLFAQLFPTTTRYTGMSFVYQFSGIYASGLTPILVTALLALGHGNPWWVCAYLITTAVISAVATLAVRPSDLHLTTPGPYDELRTNDQM